MKSSNNDDPREAGMGEAPTSTDSGVEPPLTQAEVRAMLPQQSKSEYWIKRIDVPVQLFRIAIVLLVWWLWWSEIVWDGWEAISIFGVQPFPNVPPTFRASPYETWIYFTEIYHEKLFWLDLWTTVKEALIGFAIGSGLGLLVGISLGRFRRSANVIGPFIVILNAMPKIAFLPLILIVYGVGEMSKVVLVVLITFFIVQVPVQAAVGLVDPDLDTVARTMGATQRDLFLKVTLPGITPAVLGAFRLSAIFAVQAAVFGEIFSARRGLGQRLITAANQLNYGDMFAIVFILALIALVMNGVIGYAERRALRWQSDNQTMQVVSL